MHSLESVIVEMQTEVRVELWRRSTIGRPLHAAVLGQIARLCPADASALHRADGRRAFTVSALLDAPADLQWLEPRRTYRFRLTSLCDAGARWIEAFDPCRFPDLRLLGGRMVLTGLIRTGDPWAGAASYQALMRRHLGRGTAGPNAAPRRIGLAFEAPTRSAAKDPARGLFPDPDLVFHGLAEKWLAFADETPEVVRHILDEMAERAASALRVSRYALETEPVYFRSTRGREPFMKIGFRGFVEYVADGDADPLTLCVLRMLADYAFFAGIGARTTMGMGQVRPLVEGWDIEPLPSPRSVRPFDHPAE